LKQSFPIQPMTENPQKEKQKRGTCFSSKSMVFLVFCMHKKGSKWSKRSKNSLDAGNLKNQQDLEVTRIISFRNMFDHIPISY